MRGMRIKQKECERSKVKLKERMKSGKSKKNDGKRPPVGGS